MASPLAPLLTTPRSLQHVANGTVRLSWKYQHPEAGKTQAKVAVRRKALPSGSYEYWNGTTWVGGETYVVCTTEYIDIAAGWVSGTKYQWTVRLQDNVVANGPYASDSMFVLIDAPTATVLQPTGAPAISRPLVTWVYAQAQSYSQLRYRVAVYDAATYGSGGFAPFAAGYTPFWSQDWKTSSTAWYAEIGKDVVSGTTYKAYVQVETEGGLQSAVAVSGTWTPSLTLPPAPTITAVAQQTLGSYKIDVLAAMNLLSLAGSSFEDTMVGEWQELNGCTLAASTDFASHGIYSMKVTSRGDTYAHQTSLYASYTAYAAAKTTYTLSINTLYEALTMREQTTPGISTIPVSVGAVYSAILQVRKATGSANVVARFAWYTSGGAFVSYSGTATVSANATGWTTLALTSQTAPATAAYGSLELAYTIAGINEVFYVDQAAMANTASTLWTPGSGATAFFIVERSDDSGVTWAPIQGYTRQQPAASHHPVQALISDYDRTAKMGAPTMPQYRAYVVNAAGAVSTVGSVTPAAFLLGDGWWLRDPLDPTRDLKLQQIDFQGQYEIGGDVYLPEGRSEAVVLSNNSPMSDSFNLNTWVQTDADFDKLMVLLKSRRTLFVQGMTHGLGWYVRVNGSVSYEQVMATGNRTTTIYKPLYRISAPVVQVAKTYTKAIPNTTTGVVTYQEVII